MNSDKRHAGEPIANLAIGKIVEVDGTHIVAELDAGLTELSRIYGGEVYPIGQFGSIVRVHFGRRIIYAYVGRLRMKADYEAARGVSIPTAKDERVVEAALFGEGEWKLDSADGGTVLKFDRGPSRRCLEAPTSPGLSAWAPLCGFAMRRRRRARWGRSGAGLRRSPP